MQIRISPARPSARPLSFSVDQAQLLGQADALQLAGGALRDLVQDHHLARHLEIGEPLGGEIADRALVGLGPSRRTTAAATSSPSLGVRHGEGHDLLPPPDDPSARRRPPAG
jgi:hypothetical protein